MLRPHYRIGLIQTVEAWCRARPRRRCLVSRRCPVLGRPSCPARPPGLEPGTEQCPEREPEVERYLAPEPERCPEPLKYCCRKRRGGRYQRPELRPNQPTGPGHIHGRSSPRPAGWAQVVPASGDGRLALRGFGMAAGSGDLVTWCSAGDSGWVVSTRATSRGRVRLSDAGAGRSRVSEQPETSTTLANARTSDFMLPPEL